MSWEEIIAGDTSLFNTLNPENKSEETEHLINVANNFD